MRLPVATDISSLLFLLRSYRLGRQLLLYMLDVNELSEVFYVFIRANFILQLIENFVGLNHSTQQKSGCSVQLLSLYLSHISLNLGFLSLA